jgi:hypothetical protein
MSEPTAGTAPGATPEPTAVPTAGAGDDVPEPGWAWVQDAPSPTSEAEREARETVRTVSRLEECN